MPAADAQLDEATLITRCQHGDMAAFDALVSAHASRVYTLTYRMLGSQQDAEDAAQEAFLRAFSGLARFRGGATFSTWLHRIAINVCLDELRRRPRRPQPFSSLSAPDDEAGADVAEDALLAIPAAEEPSEIIARRSQTGEIEQALQALPDQQRAVVVLCDVDGLTYEEAADALRTNVGTIKSRLHRARQRLRQLLSPHGELLVDK